MGEWKTKIYSKFDASICFEKTIWIVTLDREGYFTMKGCEKHAGKENDEQKLSCRQDEGKKLRKREWVWEQKQNKDSEREPETVHACLSAFSRLIYESSLFRHNNLPTIIHARSAITLTSVTVLIFFLRGCVIDVSFTRSQALRNNSILVSPAFTFID